MDHGRLVFERYAQGLIRDDAHNLVSVNKSVTSALVGIALRLGAIGHLDQTLADVLPSSLLSQEEPNKKEITLRSLLTMTTSLAQDTVEFDARKHFISAVLDLPLRGNGFYYLRRQP